ncbi:hypothetical protein FOCC_FOCC016587 [Frankliniella occidentalis]|nr:hypothetical protein FOCC_FOCC016587 [Frankliniella occidentalis]
MKSCFVPDCDHVFGVPRADGKICTFHRFPRTPSRKYRWTQAIRRKDKVPNEHDRVCGCHFEGLSGVLQTPRAFKRYPQYRHLFLTPEDKKKRKSKVRKQLQSPSPCKPNQQLSESNAMIHLEESGDSEILAIPLEPLPELDDPDELLPQQSAPPGPNQPVSQERSFAVTTPAGPPILVLKRSLSTGRKLARKIADELNEKREAVDLLSKEKVTLKRMVNDLQIDVQSLKNDLAEKDKIIQSLLLEENLLKRQVSELEQCSEKLKSSEEKLSSCRRDLADLENACNRKENEKTTLNTRLCTALRSSTELSLKLKEEQERLQIENISCLDSKISHYTGLPNSGTFFWLLSLFENHTLVYYHFNVTSISRENQLLLTLMRLKLAMKRQTLADWFRCSTQTVTNIVNTWLDALHIVLFKGFMKEIPSLAKVQTCLPECFKPFPNCRIILDCTEVETAIPKSMRNHNLTYSQYKHRTTHKGLVGIAPNGTVVFASKLYPGSTSDKAVVGDTKICELFNPGESIMVDKGFLITEFLPPGVCLIRPPFKTTPQFTEQQVILSKKISAARVHVERAIERIKHYKILDFVPSTLVPNSSKVFQVCCALTNLMNPLLKEVSEPMGRCACFSDEED